MLLERCIIYKFFRAFVSASRAVFLSNLCPAAGCWGGVWKGGSYGKPGCSATHFPAGWSAVGAAGCAKGTLLLVAGVLDEV